jgi:hypothetical protein
MTKMEPKDLPETLKPYDAHGLRLGIRSGRKDATADCIYCGREGKFNILIDKGTFRCAVCNEAGNQYSFIRKLHEESMKLSKESDYTELLADRKLLHVKSLATWGVCKSILNGQWLVPAYGIEGSMNNLYQYVFNGERKLLLPTTTMKHQLLGRNLFDASKPLVYLCEGLWDAMSLWEILGSAKSAEGDSTHVQLMRTSNINSSLLAESNVVGIPGAMVFDSSWCSLFADKTVIFMCQNDHPHLNEKTNKHTPPASYSGMARIAKMLLMYKTPPAGLLYLHWGDNGYDLNSPTGYDIRDLLTHAANT